MKNKYIVIALALLVVGAGAYLAGTGRISVQQGDEEAINKDENGETIGVSDVSKKEIELKVIESFDIAKELGMYKNCSDMMKIFRDSYGPVVGKIEYADVDSDGVNEAIVSKNMCANVSDAFYGIYKVGSDNELYSIADSSQIDGYWVRWSSEEKVLGAYPQGLQTDKNNNFYSWNSKTKRFDLIGAEPANKRG